MPDRAPYPQSNDPQWGTPGTDPVEIAWRETWPDEGIPDDIVAHDGHYQIGRVFPGKPSNSRETIWRWFATLFGQGIAPSRREAMLAVEDGYNAWRARREDGG